MCKGSNPRVRTELLVCHTPASSSVSADLESSWQCGACPVPAPGGVGYLHANAECLLAAVTVFIYMWYIEVFKALVARLQQEFLQGAGLEPGKGRKIDGWLGMK